MKKFVSIIIIALAGLAAVYFLPVTAVPNQDKLERQILNADMYPSAARDIAGRINDLSPTPPTGKSWTVTEVEFVENQPYAYAIYNDTHNVFRLLLETGTYRLLATFEPEGSGWKLTHGEDLAKGKETVKITVN